MLLAVVVAGLIWGGAWYSQSPSQESKKSTVQVTEKKMDLKQVKVVEENTKRLNPTASN